MVDNRDNAFKGLKWCKTVIRILGVKHAVQLSIRANSSSFVISIAISAPRTRDFSPFRSPELLNLELLRHGLLLHVLDDFAKKISAFQVLQILKTDQDLGQALQAQIRLEEIDVDKVAAPQYVRGGVVPHLS